MTWMLRRQRQRKHSPKRKKQSLKSWILEGSLGMQVSYKGGMSRMDLQQPIRLIGENRLYLSRADAALETFGSIPPVCV